MRLFTWPAPIANRQSLFALLFAIFIASPAAAQSHGANYDDFDRYVGQAVRDWRVPGLAIVVVKDDSVVFIKGYGVRELGKPDPVTVHTAFGNMSTTKAFTAMLLAMLVDSGRVQLDAPATRYIPELQLADPYVTRELTVRDLLTHRVGFPDPSFLWDQTGLSFDEVMRRVRYVPPATSIRSRFAYNNVAYAIAGEVAARSSHTTWQQLLHQRLLSPLGMTETYADGRELHAAGVRDVTSPHGIVNDTVRVLPAPAEMVDAVAPAGSMFSSATDMGKWIRFLLDSAKLGGHRLVSAPSFADLFTAQQVVPPDEFYPTARLTRPHFQAYGMGWFLEDYRGQFVAFHTGSIEGRSAIVGLIPDRHLGVAIMTNLDHSELRHALMYTVFDRDLGAEVGASHDWSREMRAMYSAAADSAKMRGMKHEQARIPNTHPTLALDKYAGTYTDTLFGAATIALDAGRLTIRLGDMRGTLEHWNYDVFRVRWTDEFQGTSFVSFSLDPDGSVGELRIVGGPMRFRRMKAK